MKLPLCRLCHHEHGLSSPHVFTKTYSSDGGPTANAGLGSAHLKMEGESLVRPWADRRRIGKSKSGGMVPRQAKVSGSVKLTDNTVDEVGAAKACTPKSAEPSHLSAADWAKLPSHERLFLPARVHAEGDPMPLDYKTDHEAFRNGLIKDLPKFKAKALKAAIAKIEAKKPTTPKRKAYLAGKAAERRAATKLGLTVAEYRKRNAV